MKGVKRMIIGSALCFAAGATLLVSGCDNDAAVVNRNMVTQAENFGILRRVIWLNTRTEKYEMIVEGYCNIDKGDTLPDEVIVLCKSPSGYQKHFFFGSRDLSLTVQQLDSTGVSAQHYVVTFKPEALIPNINIR